MLRPQEDTFARCFLRVSAGCEHGAAGVKVGWRPVPKDRTYSQSRPESGGTLGLLRGVFMATSDDNSLNALDEKGYQIASRIDDLVDQVYRRNIPRTSDFLDPYGQKVAAERLDGVEGIVYRFFGGYKQAERARLTIFPDFYLSETFEPPVTVLEARVRSDEPVPGHRDWLGAIMNCGIRREKVGDLLITSDSCQMILAAEVLSAVTSGLHNVAGQPVELTEIQPEQLDVEPETTKEIRSTVASLRLDSVASSGFGVSRSRMAREIRGERVRVNWKVVPDPAATIDVGDVISIRGRGRMVLREITGKTRKDRLKVVLDRYM